MHAKNMKTLKYVYWQNGDMWLGHLEEFPDYLTQAETLEELQGKSQRYLRRTDERQDPRRPASRGTEYRLKAGLLAVALSFWVPGPRI
jgi:hypothetical protein